MAPVSPQPLAHLQRRLGLAEGAAGLQRVGVEAAEANRNSQLG